ADGGGRAGLRADALRRDQPPHQQLVRPPLPTALVQERRCRSVSCPAAAPMTPATIERRRAAVLRLVAPADQLSARVAAAPPAYVLTQHSSDIARQCMLLSPVPASAEVRVVATPTP